jgi:hypothetical protein
MPRASDAAPPQHEVAHPHGRGVWAAAVPHLGSQQVSRVVYGAIIGLALLVALEDNPPAAGAVIVSLTGTAAAVGLAELYSDAVGTETQTRRRISRADLKAIADDAAAVGFGIAFPVVFFVLAALGVLETPTAFTAAKWTGLGLIGLYGFWAARLAGARLPGAALHAAAVGSIGGILILLKALLH